MCPVPPASVDSGVRVDGHVGGLLDPLDEVSRHRIIEPAAQRHDVDLSGEAGEEQRRLPGRVAAAEDVDFLVAACRRLDRGRPVVHARADERGAAGGVEPSKRNADRQEDRVRGELRPVVQRHAALQFIAAQGGRAPGDDDLDPKSFRLLDRASGEVAAVEAAWESRIVLDHGAVARLTTRDVLLDDHRAKTLGCSVDRRRQASRSSADDEEVVQRRPGFGRKTEPLGQRLDIRIAQDDAIGQDHDRK